MKRYHTRWWNEIVEKQESVCIANLSNDIKIVRVLTQEDNEFWNIQKNVLWMYGKGTINTTPNVIDLQTGKIFRMHMSRLHFKKECIKMEREYNKSYFDNFDDKLELRQFYNEAMILYNWYDSEYDGRYDYGKPFTNQVYLK